MWDGWLERAIQVEKSRKCEGLLDGLLLRQIPDVILFVVNRY
jgi:hypothetical protein